jgi:hypothetical protein
VSFKKVKKQVVKQYNSKGPLYVKQSLVNLKKETRLKKSEISNTKWLPELLMLAVRLLRDGPLDI